MYRRVLPYLTIVVVLACNVDNTTQPPPPLPTSASPVISDGAHGAGNPDFFFIPSTVPNPKNDPDYGDPFNGSLLPVVTICELDEVPPDANVDAASDCKIGGYTLPPTVASVDLVAEKYQVDWMVPVAPPVYYRIWVTVGSDTLGYADVKTGPTPQSLKGTSQANFITRVDGSDLPIKFRIEEFALCDTPGTGPCSSESVDTNEGGEVEIAEGGVVIASGSGNTTHTITVEVCPDLNPTHTDLPQFGSCIRVTADPPLPPGGLTEMARVYACDIGPDLAANVFSAAQEDRVSLHRLDGTTLNALPHADDACTVPASSVRSASLGGLVADIARGRWKSARGQLVGMLAPKPLHASIMLDEGGGGETPEFSDFQFLLPSTVAIESGNNQTGVVGFPVADSLTVKVTDLGGEPVKGARVTFTTTDGSVSPSSFVTGANGKASTKWTLGSEGANTMTASGRGIAGDDPNNGPRPSVQDPWQPLDQTLGDGSDGGEVLVGTGSRTFTATGHQLFGSAFTGAGGGAGSCTCPANLYWINPSTGAATLIGPIGFNRVGALDVHPTTGVVYATAQRAADNVPVLIKINLATGAGIEIGPTAITTGIISDISFRNDGVLFVYDANPPDHLLYTANLTTGAAVFVGDPGFNNIGGNGIGHDASGTTLYHSNVNSSHTLNQTNGASTPVAAMSFPSSCTSLGSARIGATDLNATGNVFYSAVKCGTQDFLGTADYTTGAVFIIGSTVSGLSGLVSGSFALPPPIP